MRAEPADTVSDREQVAGLVDELRTVLGGTLPDEVEAAVELARRGHQGQRRRSGEPYVVHPLHTAILLAGAGWDTTTVAAGVCHDLLEDTSVTRGEIAAAAGEDAARIVEGVTRMDHVRTKDVAAEAADVQRLLGAVAGDVRVLGVKLADRLHNLRTLEHLAPAKRERISRQTLEILAPLAHRIGAQAWCRELEDRCFYWAYPDEWAWLDQELSSTAADREALADRLTSSVEAALATAGIHARVESRTKGRWSLWCKLSRVGGLDRVWDQVGLRVVVDDATACYAALGVVHSLFTPVPGRVKDYVALPKDNGYRSLHTTVVDADGQHFEVQIRDDKMDLDARYGVAAHHRYKAQGGSRMPGPDVHVDASGLGPEEFLDELRAELADTGQVLVLTPAGDVVTLPFGSCSIDFAYAVHTEVGHRCVGARVNGRLVPIRQPLSTGDTVEILTRERAAPSRDWLESVASASARYRIRRHFSQLDRDEHERAGRVALERALAERGRRGEQPDAAMLRRGGVNEVDELYRMVGSGKVSLDRVLDAPSVAAGKERVVPARRSAVGVEGLRSQPAGCCAPTGSEPMVGYVSVGRGLIVHRADCANLVALRAALPEDQKGRIMELSSAGGSSLEVTASDRDGLLADVAAVFAAAGVSLAGSRTTHRGTTVEITLGLPEMDRELADELAARVAAVRSVLSVRSPGRP